MFDFSEWVNSAARGETVEYFNGELARTRCEVAEDKRRGNHPCPDLDAALRNAREAWALYESGVVTLSQRRAHAVKPGVHAYSYLATRA
jgi:hypothetical protein